jgi:CelD/BcsL family acetyltransferase involved in cellulose biosynthesis
VEGRILGGPDQWAQVGPVWTALSAEVPLHSHLQLVSWARGLTEHVHDDRTRWFLADDDRGPVAVVPYQLVERRVGPARVRSLLTDKVSDSLVSARARPPDLRRALLAASAAAGEPIDVLSYNGMRPGSGTLRLATSAPSGLSAETRHGGYSVIETGVSGDDWFAATSKNLRAGLRKARNRFERRGKLTITAATAPDEVEAGFDVFVDVEASGWKVEAGALVNRPAERALLRQFLVEESERGAAEVRVLRLDDRPAAVQLATVTGRTLELYKVAYVDELADLSPSNLLMADLVRSCCDRPGIDRIDLITNQPWHDRWHATEHPTYQARDADLRRPGGIASRLAATLRRRGRPAGPA